MDLKDIKQIVEMMKGNDLSFFNIETGDFKLKLRRGVDTDIIAEAIKSARVSVPVPAPAPVATPVQAPSPEPGTPTAPSSQNSSGPAPQGEVDGESLPTINSLMVGTFYRSPSPDSAPFIKVGDSVDEDTVVCIIEAMKIMNEIKAEMKGTITKVLVDDGKPVQYGEPLFEIKP